MNKVRIAVIGNGIIGEDHISNYAKCPDAEVVALCDINEERLNYIGDKYGIKDRYTHIGKMLQRDDFDSVDVCLHNNYHAPVAIAAMRAGNNVYCEKPMAGTFFDALSMYNTMLETGKKLHIQLGMLYGAGPRAAKKLIEAGTLGNIYHMRSYGFRRRGRPYVDGYATKEFVNTLTSGGGALFDMGVYHISQLLYLTGLPELERVCGTTYAELDMDKGRREISGYNVEELGVGFATYKGNLTMDILESWAIHAKDFPSSIICGSEGGLTLNPLTLHHRVNDIDMDSLLDVNAMDYRDHTIYADDANYDSSLRHWVAVLHGKCAQLPTAKIALETQRVQEGIYISSKLGREVTSDEIMSISASKALPIPNLAL